MNDLFGDSEREGESVLFGAGSMGINFVLSAGVKPAGRVVFCDNDSRKWGTVVAGIQVVSPEVERLNSARRIVITSLFGVDIWKGLIARGVNPRLIYFPEKSMYQNSKSPFVDHRLVAERLLNHIFASSLAKELQFFVDFGTLLGIWRDGELIRHDPDIDFCVLGDDRAVQQLLEASSDAAATLGYSFDCMESMTSARVSHKEVQVIIDISSAERVGRELHRNAPPARGLDLGIVAPLQELSGRFRVSVPAHPDTYLRLLYGDDWRVPRADWGFTYGQEQEDFQLMRSWSD